MTTSDRPAYLTGTVRAQGRTRQVVAASLDMLGATFTEHRGWLTSIFVVRATEPVWRDIHRWASDNGIPVTSRD